MNGEHARKNGIGTPKPLRLARNNWRSRWLQADRGTLLHRIAEIEWEGCDKISGPGVAVCGTTSHWFSMPGIFSRIGAKRCPKCCEALGIPEGHGAPYNSLEGRAKNR